MTARGERIEPGAPGGRWAWWPLAPLCASFDVLEFLLVRVVDPRARAQLAPQASAIFPFGVFHDLRWISVSHNSWPTFLAEVVGMLVVRGGLSALSVQLAWPPGVLRPSVWRLLVRGVASTALSAVLLVPSVSLVFGLAVVPVSWLFLAAVPSALLVALIVHPVGVARGWWKRSVPLRALGWVGLSFLVLSGAGAAMSVGPVWDGLAVAALTGLFNAWAWAGLVHAVVDREPGLSVPVVPVALATLIAVAVGGTVVGFTHVHPHRASTTEASPVAVSGAQPVLVVSGYGSTFDGTGVRVVPGPFAVRQFSYRGLSASGQPLPYRAGDTVKSIGELDRMMDAQVTALARSSGRRVDVVAESEGALVAKTALLARPDTPVDALVLASPLLQPGRTTYPQPGAAGWGVAAGEFMTLIGRAFQSVAPIDLSPDSAFLRSVDSQASVLQNAMSCPVVGVRQLALLPLADATVTPVHLPPALPSVVVSAFHGGLLGEPGVEALVARFLEHRPVRRDSLLQAAHYAIRLASAAWQIPATPTLPSPTSCSAAGDELAAQAFGR